DAGSYAKEEGTSSAAPQVSGAAALLLSVPGVKPGDVKTILTSTAALPAGGIADKNMFGAGILDVYAALQKVAVGVTIISPIGTGGKASGTIGNIDPVETLRPEIRIGVLQFTPDQIKITVDGVNIPPLVGTAPGYTIENIQQSKTVGGVTTPVRYDAVIRNLNLAPGTHTIVVIGTNPGPPVFTDTDTRTFIIQPHLWPQGRSMVSIPYYEFIANPDGSNGIGPENVIGTDFRFARWLPQSGRYAFYTSYGLKDPLAGFTPGDTMVTADGDSTVYSPLGIGYFADFGSAKPVLTHGKAISTKTFLIPLKGNGTGSNLFISWNMIGDPFNFDVPFAACLVDVGGSRISVQEAANRGLILPTIYSYDPAVGYTYRTLPDGTLKSWAGHWVGVTSSQDIKLVVPPAAISRKVNITKSTVPVGTTWTMQLGVHSKSLHDANNVIGVGGRSAETYDLQDVPKPPLVGPYVGLAVEHKDWGNRSGLYAQDIRSSSSNHSWNVVVSTDQTNTDVTVNWTSQSIPRNTRVSIKDEVTGQVYDMRTRASLTFNSGSDAATRRFTLTSRPASQDAVHVSNVAVRSGRASGVSSINFTLSSDASYDVKIVSATGATVNNIASRAAAAGNVSLVWQGRDNSGKNVAPGTYLVQIKATGTGGDSVNVVYPFAVVR
ncbi:MAG: FlgD immunoglobulin-like domain containing protein, partial [Chthonomonadales bacterium]